MTSGTFIFKAGGQGDMVISQCWVCVVSDGHTDLIQLIDSGNYERPVYGICGIALDWFKLLV